MQPMLLSAMFPPTVKLNSSCLHINTISAFWGRGVSHTFQQHSTADIKAMSKNDTRKEELLQAEPACSQPVEGYFRIEQKKETHRNVMIVRSRQAGAAALSALPFGCIKRGQRRRQA